MSCKHSKPYIVGNHLVFLISLDLGDNLEEKPDEEIRTFRITNSYDLIEEKNYIQQRNIKLNFDKYNPVVTYLSSTSHAESKKIEKIAFLTDIIVNVQNDISDFFFEDKTFLCLIMIMNMFWTRR